MAEKKLVGVDVFIEYDQEDRNPQVLGKRIEAISAASELKLSLITNRGAKVYPRGLQETTCTDHWRCSIAKYSACLQLLMQPNLTSSRPSTFTPLTVNRVFRWVRESKRLGSSLKSDL